MMLRVCARAFSSFPASKVRAYPFKLSPADAVVHMAPYASLTGMFQNLFSSIGARLLPGFGFEPLQPTRITPVYFPAWVIDAEVQATLSLSRDDATEHLTTTIQLLDSYLPGADYKVLSAMSLWTNALKRHQAVAFTDELKTQHGIEIPIIPYNISPFSALDVARSLSYSDANIHENLRFLPNSIKPTLLAAYPVLIPLYLAQYDTLYPGMDKPYTQTIFIEAFSDHGRIVCETLGGAAEALSKRGMKMPTVLMELLHSLGGLDINIMRGLPARFAKVRVPQGNEGSTLGLWLNNQFESSHDAAKKLSAVSDLTDDIRIREYVKEEVNPVRAWMNLSAQLIATKTMFEAMSSRSHNITILGGKDSPDLAKSFETTIDSMKTTLSTLESSRETTKPSWWKEWETKQPDSKPTS